MKYIQSTLTRDNWYQNLSM